MFRYKSGALTPKPTSGSEAVLQYQLEHNLPGASYNPGSNYNYSFLDSPIVIGGTIIGIGYLLFGSK